MDKSNNILTKEERDSMILDNMNLVYYIVHKTMITNPTYEFEDLVSIGIEGLIKAVDKYDNSKDCKLSTYATNGIKQYLLNYINKTNKNHGKDYLNLSLDLVDDNNVCLSHLIPDTTVNIQKSLEINDIINKCIASKTDPYKEIFELYSTGHTIRYIANKMSYSESYTSRVISKIKKEINKELLGG